MKNAIAIIVFLYCGGITILKAQNQFKPSSPGPHHLHNFSVPHKAMSSGPIPFYDSICDWDGELLSQQYSPYDKYIGFVYDTNNNLARSIYQTLHGGRWENNEIFFYTYNSNNLGHSKFTQSWSGSLWVNSQLITLFYNSHNLDTNEVTQTWNGSAWVNYSHNLFYYNSNDLEVNETYQTWNGSAWVNNEQYLFYYNSKKLDTNEVYQNWNGSTWVNFEDYQYSYNSNNKLTYMVESGPGGVGDVVYTYDTNNTLLTSLFTGIPFWLSGTNYYFHYKVKGSDTNSGNNSDTNNIPVNKIKNTFIVYPNPNNGTFTIHLDSASSGVNNNIEFYNVLGQKIYQALLPNYSSAISVSLGVPTGLYFYDLQNSKGVKKGKIVIKR